jgi:hypothetical protein
VTWRRVPRYLGEVWSDFSTSARKLRFASAIRPDARPTHRRSQGAGHHAADGPETSNDRLMAGRYRHIRGRRCGSYRLTGQLCAPAEDEKSSPSTCGEGLLREQGAIRRRLRAT